jgi:single-strand DNA-binding protein
MANLNKVFFMGNLTRDPELRYLPNGTAVTTFTVAANRAYKLPSGEKKEEATFMRVVVWGRRAETCGEFLNKGSSVFVEGRLQARSWQGQDGQTRNTVEIVADNVQFLGKPKREGQPAKVPQETEGAQGPTDIIPDVDFPSGSAETSEKSGDDETPF